MIAASSSSGGMLVGAAGPRRAKLAREVLRACVAGPREGEDLAALIPRHLRHDMGRGAEAIDAEARRVAGHLQRAVADQPGAEQRRCFGVAVAFRQMEAVARVGDRVRGVAAVDLVAGEARAVAEIFAAVAAIGAGAVGPAEPRHADAVADGESPPPPSQAPPRARRSRDRARAEASARSARHRRCAGRCGRRRKRARASEAAAVDGSGIGSSVSLSGDPGASSTIACMVVEASHRSLPHPSRRGFAAFRVRITSSC